MFEQWQFIATSTAIMRSQLWQFNSALLKCLSVLSFILTSNLKVLSISIICWCSLTSC